MTNWRIKPSGDTITMYKDGEKYATHKVAEPGVWKRLAERYAHLEGFTMYDALDHYETTGEKEFEL